MAQSIPQNVIHGLQSMLPPLDRLYDQNEKEPASKKDDITPVDVVIARIMLTKGKKLPPDVVDMIFDFAEYWAHSSNEVDFKLQHQSPLTVNGGSPLQNKFVLRSYPVGLTGLQGRQALAEILAYDMTEAKPQKLEKEHETAYFAGLANYPTPKLQYPVRKVVFSIRSHDQGWCQEPENRKTYNGAWTWFEAGLEKFDAEQTCDPLCTYDVRYKSNTSEAVPLPVCALRPLYPEIEPISDEKMGYSHPLQPQDKWVIQHNKTAHRTWQDHVVTWTWQDDIKPESEAAEKMRRETGRGRDTADGSFVRNLKMGDVITVWAKARFTSWVNHVESVKIDVYWAV
ncbi:hypothetical protein FSPOR_5582 [Fusarium sporotrichioides]|uniref:Uncharacterized protein n=1 Tax=Fusarium sporotrichioides TaxID=5514 RepID=A0A395S6B7_FUSSP|nr:hypothetical protein FSPOR_5582 [Fusarium sporotrichioides]